MARFILLLCLSWLPLSTATAADPIELTLGGHLREYFYVADQDNRPTERLSATGLMNDVRVAFQGRTVLDNGITVRAFIQLYALGRTDRTLDEAYVELNSGLGKLRLGEKEGVNRAILGDPVPEALLTSEEEILERVLRPRTGITVRDAFTFRRFTGKSLGISLQGPEIGGLAIGASYHPELSRDAGGAPINKSFVANNGVDVTAMYSGDYPGGTYRIGGGFFHSNPGRLSLRDGHKAWNVVVGVTYGGWDLSGAYIDVRPTSGLDETAWTVGALYAIGPFQVSANFMRADREATRDGRRRERLDRETLQGAYKLAPGITLGITGFRADQTDATGANWDGAGVLSGLKVVF